MALILRNTPSERYPVFICYTKHDQPEDWSFHLHQHSDTLEITYLFRGTLDVFCRNTHHVLQKDAIAITNPGIFHGAKALGPGPMERVVFQFRGPWIENLKEGLLIYQSDPEDPAKNNFMLTIQRLFRYLLFRYQAEEEEIVAADSDTVLLTEDILALLFRMLSSLVSRQKPDQKKKEKDDAVVLSIMDYIEQNFEKKMTVNTLTNLFFLSPYYLAHKFKKVTGFTVNEFLSSCRIGEAEELLLFSDEKVPYIASVCGFDNYSYFYTVFKKINGCTPLEYRQHRKYTYFTRIDSGTEQKP